MFDFHFMYRNVSKFNLYDLQSFISELDTSGYYSILMVYNSNKPDGWIQSANIIKKNEKIKYNIALRTHAISPEYCIMMCKAFNSIDKDRLMLNFIAGNIGGDEKTPTHAIGNNYKEISKDERLQTLDNFLGIFLKNNNGLAEIAISGSSYAIFESAKKYADILFLEYGAYEQKRTKVPNLKKIGVLVKICIRDTEEAAENFILKSGEHGWDPRFYGTYEKIKNNILNINKQEVSDVMIAMTDSDNNFLQVNSLVKDLSNLNRV
jgi:hypothetical protein